MSNRLQGRVALVTGASSGIGMASARAFAHEGAHVLLVARRLDRLASLSAELGQAHGVRTHALALDVRDREAVDRSLGSLDPPWSSIDILLNNAGLSRGLAPVHEGDVRDWEEMIDTNVKGLLYVTRCVVPGMVSRGRGHVINIGSIAGREVYERGNVYCATKYAVRALTEGLRLDLHGTGVRVSTVDPGIVETEFSVVRFRGDAERAAKVYADTRPLRPEDVADAVIYCATRPAHVSVAELVLLAADQSSATRIHRAPQERSGGVS